MDTVIQLLTVLLPLLYALAAANYSVCFMRDEPFAHRTVTPFLAVTFLLHILYLILRLVHYKVPPIVGTPSVLSLVALGMTGAYLYVERIQHNKYSGLFILLFVVGLQLASSTFEPKVTPVSSPLLDNSLFAVHVVIAVLGYSAFALGAVYGLMYLLLYRALKRRRFGLMFERLPSLDVLANMGFWATVMGWVALTLAMLLGIVMSIQAVPGFYRDLKFISTVLVWLVYGLGIAGRFWLGWRGARTVYFSLAGFAFAVLAMLASTFLYNTFHTFQA